MITSSMQILQAPGPAAGLDRIQQDCNPNWSCPIPPRENRLKVAIRAGEKVFEVAAHE